MELELKVAEAMDDVGRGIVKMNKKSREALGVKAGDIVEIVGKRATVAVVQNADDYDEDLDIVRMDYILRINARAFLGEKVKIKKANIRDAIRVVLFPIGGAKPSLGFGEFIKRRLIGRPIVEGDRISVDVLGTKMSFIVSQTLPGGAVKITESTEVSLKDKELRDYGYQMSLSEGISILSEEIRKTRKMFEMFLMERILSGGEYRIENEEVLFRFIEEMRKNIEQLEHNVKIIAGKIADISYEINILKHKIKNFEKNKDSS